MSQEKVYIRFCESYRIAQASEPIEVDVESLRKCTPAYEGNTAEELLEYIEEIHGDYDWYEDNKENFEDEDDAYALIFEEWPEMETFDDSRNKGADTWLEVGEPNEEYRSGQKWRLLTIVVIKVLTLGLKWENLTKSIVGMEIGKWKQQHLIIK